LQTETRHIRRQSLIAFLGLGVALVIGAQLVSLQLVASDAYITKAKVQHEKVVTLQANRGRILDRNGRVLITSLEAQSFFVNEASELDDLKRIAVSFSRRGLRPM
jgi:cell division protein FtsI (penicillin-binding protein 3)